MSSPAVDVNFFRGVLAGLVFATATAGAGLFYAVLTIPR
jgi:hypothetical protein